MRTTKKEVYLAFKHLCKQLDVTDWQLDYVACYGGYMILDKENHAPFGHRRLSAKEAYFAYSMAAEAAEIANNKKEVR